MTSTILLGNKNSIKQIICFEYCLKLINLANEGQNIIFLTPSIEKELEFFFQSVKEVKQEEQKLRRIEIKYVQNCRKLLMYLLNVHQLKAAERPIAIVVDNIEQIILNTHKAKFIQDVQFTQEMIQILSVIKDTSNLLQPNQEIIKSLTYSKITCNLSFNNIVGKIISKEKDARNLQFANFLNNFYNSIFILEARQVFKCDDQELQGNFTLKDATSTDFGNFIQEIIQKYPSIDQVSNCTTSILIYKYSQKFLQKQCSFYLAFYSNKLSIKLNFILGFINKNKNSQSQWVFKISLCALSKQQNQT